MNGNLRDLYTQRFEKVLVPMAERLRAHVTDCVGNMARVDRITARAKTPDSFISKADELNQDGSRRYRDPLADVQDILGVRIIVFYKDDVDSAVEVVRRYFHPIEQRRLVPESEWSFGYFGLHMILALPEDVIRDERRQELPEFFEMQIKTLFQHAWSEANHDLGYKPIENLSPEQQRRLAFAAAQAWGADREFTDLQAELTRN